MLFFSMSYRFIDDRLTSLVKVLSFNLTKNDKPDAAQLISRDVTKPVDIVDADILT